MSRNTEYKFVPTDSTEIVAEMTAAYEKMTGRKLQPADPDKLFIAWIADVIIQERVNQNYVGNQNIPSRAVGDNLDALGNWIYDIPRTLSQPSMCIVRFSITIAQQSVIVIPAGTRVTDVQNALVWETMNDATIAIGDTYTDTLVQCQTAGTIGNGYVPGQINTLIDVDNIPYFDSCSNITDSDGGSEAQSDDNYYESMRAIVNSHSTAGAEGSYVYWAKSVTPEIADVKAICPNIEREETLSIFTGQDGEKYAFLGGEQIDINTLQISINDFTTVLTENTDYTADYTDGLLKIKIVSTSAAASATTIDVKVKQRRAGYVYLYALMQDGTIAGETIKQAIYDVCSADSVRPLTDCVVVDDAEEVTYNINCTYYIQSGTSSAAEISDAVTQAISEYKSWQCAKLGRDINPDKLRSLLMNTGIKRVTITSPVFTPLKNGASNDPPQVAKIGTVSVINGGFEDE